MTVLRPQRRGTGPDALAALLASDRFRLGHDAGRVAHNLATHGGVIDDRAGTFIGTDLPPLGALSVALGAARGTLGPFSFGFLDNHRGIAALAAPLPARPPVGSIALVCGRRDALPDVGPLCVARGLPVSWIISVGEGDAEGALAFLAADAATTAVLVAAPGVRPGALGALSGKPAVMLGGDALLRAAVRRGGGAAVDDLEAWLAHGSLLGAGASAVRAPRAAVVGGGAALVEQTLRDAGLAIDVWTIADDDQGAVGGELARAAEGADLMLVVGSEPVLLPPLPSLFVEVGQLDRLRALAAAVVARRPAAPAQALRLPAERAQARAILLEAGPLLGDHHTKRILKCYGVVVSRQAPANSATAALRVATTLGLPVEVAIDPALSAATRALLPTGSPAPRLVHTAAELRRAAALVLDGAVPYLLVRQAFAASPRARFALRRDRDLPTLAVVGGAVDERALLPLDVADAAVLARAAAGPAASPALADLLLRTAACADEQGLELEIEVFLGQPPVVVAAAARLLR